MANPDSQHRNADTERLFAEALALPPAGRTAFLAAQCGSDPALRRELESLLEHHDAPSGLLDRSPAPIALDALLDRSDPVLAPSREDLTGQAIDGYELVERLGEGGMGAVYLAVQRTPVKREVAMKLLRAGLGTSEILARFDAERQALALMDHPNIARIYDAAATADDAPTSRWRSSTDFRSRSTAITIG